VQRDDKEGHMRRRKALASLLAMGSLALALAVPANASVPQGNGLQDLGTFECEGLGTVSVFGPAGGPVGLTTSGLHAIARSLSGEFTDPEGNVVPFSKTFGQKAGFGPFYTCHQEFEGGFLTVEVALVPPGTEASGP
jgi:hypothetical protein